MTYKRFIILQYRLLTWGVSLHYGSLNSHLQRLPSYNQAPPEESSPFSWEGALAFEGECRPSLQKLL